MIQYLQITLNTPIYREEPNDLWRNYLISHQNIHEDLLNFSTKWKALTQISLKTVNLYLQITLMYLKEYGILIDEIQTHRLKKTRPKNRVISRETELDITTIWNILSHADTRQRAEILIAVSSGMRIREILGITLSDLNLTVVPAEIYILASIAKSDTAWTIFISQEATKALKEWIVVRDNELKRKNPGAAYRIPESFPIPPQTRLPVSTHNSGARKHTPLIHRPGAPGYIFTRSANSSSPSSNLLPPQKLLRSSQDTSAPSRSPTGG